MFTFLLILAVTCIIRTNHNKIHVFMELYRSFTSKRFRTEQFSKCTLVTTKLRVRNGACSRQEVNGRIWKKMDEGVEVFDLIEGTIPNKVMPELTEGVARTSINEGWPETMGRKTQEFPAVIPLNVGGVRYMTLLSTLRKYPDSMLAAMFSGRHDVSTDDQGHYFIDTNGTCFNHILDYLRHESLPPPEVVEQVYKLALYFGIQDLVDALQSSPKIARIMVHNSHRLQFPNFDQIKVQVIKMAMKLATATKIGEVVIHPYKLAPDKDKKVAKHACITDTADIIYGPWKTEPDEEIFIRTLENDLKESGFLVTRDNRKRCKHYSGGSTCQKFIYKLSISFV